MQASDICRIVAAEPDDWSHHTPGRDGSTPSALGRWTSCGGRPTGQRCPGQRAGGGRVTYATADTAASNNATEVLGAFVAPEAVGGKPPLSDNIRPPLPLSAPAADGILYGAGYFAGTYRNYERQNPRRKVEWYLRQAHKWLPPTPARHLDMGCGLGAMLDASIRRGNHATGTDISPYAVSEASGRVSAATVLVSPATNQPFPDASFDLISVLDVLEHLDEPRRALVEVRRLLGHQGVALLVVPVYDGLSGPVIRRLDRDPTHLHRLARAEWLSIVGEVLEVQEWVGMFRLLPPIGPYLHWPTVAMRRHTPAIAIIARRSNSN